MKRTSVTDVAWMVAGVIVGLATLAGHIGDLDDERDGLRQELRACESHAAPAKGETPAGQFLRWVTTPKEEVK